MTILCSDIDTGTALITLSDPANGNCVDAPALRLFARLLDDLGQRRDLHTVIITGADGNLCKGRIADGTATTAAEIGDDLQHILAVNERLGRLGAVVIAAVEGEALGFGCGLATQCDITIAGEGAIFALPELSHGLPPLIVLSYLTRYVPYKQAFELALTSRRIDAARAVEIGMATRLAPAGAALAEAKALARFIGTLNPRAVRDLRAYMRRSASLNDDALAQYGLCNIANILSENRTSRHDQ